MLVSTALYSTNYKNINYIMPLSNFYYEQKNKRTSLKLFSLELCTFLIELDQVTIEKEIFTKENKSHRPNFSINFFIIKHIMDKF